MISKVLMALVLLAFGAYSSFGLSLDRGALRLVVNEKNGRFSLYQVKASDPVTAVPLFVASDPTTSQWRLQINNKVFVLGDSSSFATKVESTDGGAQVTWTSKTLLAVLRFQFLQSSGATEVDGLRLDLDLTNTGTETASVGVRWLLDTILGEKKDHFELADGTTVNRERQLSKPYPDYWASNSATDDAGLKIELGGKSTVPSRVIFANWKRLNDAPWEFEVKDGREFSLMPYSFNDSAVAQFYETQPLATQDTRRISVEMALRSVSDFSAMRAVGANALSSLLTSTRDPALGEADQDLASLDVLLKQIDADLKKPAGASVDDLRLIQAALDQIEARIHPPTESKPRP